jgi:hypothetical protein
MFSVKHFVNSSSKFSMFPVALRMWKYMHWYKCITIVCNYISDYEINVCTECEVNEVVGA